MICLDEIEKAGALMFETEVAPCTGVYLAQMWTCEDPMAFTGQKLVWTDECACVDIAVISVALMLEEQGRLGTPF